MLPTVSDLRRKNQAWREVALHPPPSAEQAGGAAKKEHLLLQWNASAAGLHHAKFARLHMPVNMWSHKVC